MKLLLFNFLDMENNLSHCLWIILSHSSFS